MWQFTVTRTMGAYDSQSCSSCGGLGGPSGFLTSGGNLF